VEVRRDIDDGPSPGPPPAQLPVADLPEREWDVVVNGAGPAGSTCALVLARAGLSVLLVDKQRFPRPKTCGDILMPDTLAVLTRLGLRQRVDSMAHRFSSFRVFSPANTTFAIPGEFRAWCRHDYDTCLVNEAVTAGVVFARGTTTDVEDRGGVVRVQFKACHRPIATKVAVIATGASVHLTHRLGMVTQRKPSAVAIRQYIRADFDLKEAVLAYVREILPAFAWIIPLGDGLFNVGCGVRINGGRGSDLNLRDTLEQFKKSFPLAVELAGRATDVGKPTSAVLRCGLTGNRHVHVGRIVATGETIGTTFPFTGEGIGKAMQAGEIAGEVVVATLAAGDINELAVYRERLDRELAPAYEGYFVAERWLARASVNDFMARRVAKSPFLQRELARFIAGTGDPRRLYSPWSIIRSLWQ